MKQIKESIKKEIEDLPENALERLYKFIRSLKNSKPDKSCDLPSYSLKGQFDDVDIRSQAYE